MSELLARPAGEGMDKGRRDGVEARTAEGGGLWLSALAERQSPSRQLSPPPFARVRGDISLVI